MQRKSFVLMVMGTVILLLCSISSADVPDSINYQGKLTTANGGCMNDTVQMTFTIYSDELGISDEWSETQTEVLVKEGIFSVFLGSVNPLPDTLFDGSIKYLGVQVESDPEMTPLKPMVSVAYAYKSLEADTADYARAGTGGGADNDWVYPQSAGGTNPRPYLYTFGPWGIARYGNVLYGNFDSTHVNLGVACTTGLSGGYNLKYCTVGGGMGNTAKGDNATVGGGYSNMAYGSSATVGGGYRNMAHSDDATIGGGVYNTAGFAATVPGGYTNAAEGPYSFVGGGGENAATDWYATVPGGFGDTAAGLYSFAAGAYVRLTSTADYTFAFGNNFTSAASHAVIFHDADTPIKVGIGTTNPTERLDVAGTAQMTGFKMPTGASNGYVLTSDASGVGSWQATAGELDWTFRITDTADTTLITGGPWGISRYGNTLHGNADSTHVNLGVACTTGTSGQNNKYCAIGGGFRNTAGGTATVGGGRDNIASGGASTVGGGISNTASGVVATVGGGENNTASGGEFATVGGGWKNTASGNKSTVGGGEQNTAGISGYTTVGGGYHNRASVSYATVGGGWSNTASNTAGTVGGGLGNTASGMYATVPGGYIDTAAGDYSLAAGGEVKISSDADYTFAFGRDFTTSTPNAVIFHNSVDPIKVGIGTTNPQYMLDIRGTTGIDVGSNFSDVPLTINVPSDQSALISRIAKGGSVINVVDADGNVGIGTTSPQGALDVNSTTGAFIVPRMTTAQRDALTPVNGMIIYNTSTNQFNFYENGAWVTK